jgi:hypothetical protein
LSNASENGDSFQKMDVSLVNQLDSHVIFASNCVNDNGSCLWPENPPVLRVSGHGYVSAEVFFCLSSTGSLNVFVYASTDCRTRRVISLIISCGTSLVCMSEGSGHVLNITILFIVFPITNRHISSHI